MAARLLYVITTTTCVVVLMCDSVRRAQVARSAACVYLCLLRDPFGGSQDGADGCMANQGTWRHCCCQVLSFLTSLSLVGSHCAHVWHGA